MICARGQVEITSAVAHGVDSGGIVLDAVIVVDFDIGEVAQWLQMLGL